MVRSCRIYSFEKRQLVHDVRKLPASFAPATLPQADDPAPTVASKTIRMFHSADTMKSFFRRLSFSPDGRILVVPAGCIEAAQSTDSISNTTFVFSRSNLSRSACTFPFNFFLYLVISSFIHVIDCSSLVIWRLWLDHCCLCMFGSMD